MPNEEIYIDETVYCQDSTETEVRFGKEERVSVGENYYLEHKFNESENIIIDDSLYLQENLGYEEFVRLLERYFLIFRRKDFENFKIEDSILVRNKTEYKKWIISIPLNDNFNLVRTTSILSGKDWHIENGSSRYERDLDKHRIMTVELDDGTAYFNLEIPNEANYLLLDYKHNNGIIELEVEKDSRIFYHYKFAENETNWRILEIPVQLESGQYRIKFYGSGSFSLHILALVNWKRELLNPRTFVETHEKPIFESDNFFKMDKVYLVVEGGVTDKQANVFWSFLNRRMLKFLRKIFNKPIVILTHERRLYPAIINNLNIAYLETGTGVAVNGKIEIL